MRAWLIASVSLLVAMGFAPTGAASEHPLVETCDEGEVGIVVNATEGTREEACFPPPVQTCGGGDVGVVVDPPDGDEVSLCFPPTFDTCDNREIGAKVAGIDFCLYPCWGTICLW